MIQWSNPREQGNVPGKLFEYLGARRPILGLGLEQGVPATIIRGRSAGFFSNDPELIAEQLLEWVRTKQRDGRISELPETACAGFERDNQFERLEACWSPQTARCLSAMTSVGQFTESAMLVCQNRINAGKHK